MLGALVLTTAFYCDATGHYIFRIFVKHKVPDFFFFFFFFSFFMFFFMFFFFFFFFYFFFSSCFFFPFFFSLSLIVKTFCELAFIKCKVFRNTNFSFFSVQSCSFVDTGSTIFIIVIISNFHLFSHVIWRFFQWGNVKKVDIFHCECFFNDWRSFLPQSFCLTQRRRTQRVRK